MESVKGNILIVEHEAIIALDIKKRFENFGYNIVNTIPSIEDIFANLHSYKGVDLILLDSETSDFSQRMSTLERIYRSLRTPLILFISKNDENIRAKCEKYDTIRVIEKPFNDKELMDAVANIIKDVN